MNHRNPPRNGRLAAFPSGGYLLALGACRGIGSRSLAYRGSCPFGQESFLRTDSTTRAPVGLNGMPAEL